MDDAVRGYIAAIDADRRPLFDRIHQLVLQVRPDVDVVLSYQMPTFVVGRYRLYVGVWKHGLSFTVGSQAATQASRPATPSSSRTRAPSNWGRTTPLTSRTTSSATSCVPSSTTECGACSRPPR